MSGGWNLESLDLDRHAVIEASAGTGKTYTIERLVLRLLLEKHVTLEQILIVTYTEKATGDLKGRLRAALEKELKVDLTVEQRRLLQNASDRFDQAAVFTIHAFCQRVLQEYPLQQGQDARARLVDDKNLWEAGLREIQRRDWPREFGANLREVLEISKYQRGDAGKWERNVQKLALGYRPECGQRLLPAAIADWPALLTELKRGLTAVLEQFGPWVREKCAERLQAEQELALNVILAWTAAPASLVRPLSSFQELFVRLDHDGPEFSEHGFRAYLPTREPAGPLTQLLKMLEGIRQAASWGSFPLQLSVRTIGQLQEYLADFKRQRGLQSFQDMIARVEEGLDSQRNPGADVLLGMLRQRFPFGIVDECQDTDPLQWSILQRIFLAGGDSKLFVVGDPKQAIFGFRGADLPTYLAGVREMAAKHGAQESPLQVNWRSVPELLAPLNRLFIEGKWFPEASGIRYLEVKAPEDQDRLTKVERDQTNRAALNLVDWRDDERLAKLRGKHARFVVAEIQRLLGQGRTSRPFRFVHKGETRTLQAGDICVLVFKRSEADPLVEGLRDAGIPYTFYKQPGLWRSDEALHLRLVLEALAQPEQETAFRKALLTRFFRISPQELALSEEVPAQHPARRLFDKWLDHAGARQWSALFGSIREDTGVLFLDGGVGQAERRRANLRHLTSFLEQAAYAGNLDLLGIVELCRHNLDPDAEHDIQPLETDRPRLQIMTLHASKGLEFPVVFLAGGFTGMREEAVQAYRDERQRRVFDLSRNDDAREFGRLERLDENRRLLYVALTRAMFKLYVPWLLPEGKKYAKGWEGPLVQLMAPALNLAQLEGLPQDQVEIIDPTRRDLKIWKPGTTLEEVEAEPMLGEALVRPEGALFPVLDPELARRRIWIRSFTSLHRAGMLRAAEAASFTEERPRVEDDDAGEQDLENPLRGAVFGEIVHNVLEKIDFADVAGAPSPDVLLETGAATEMILGEEVGLNLPRLQSMVPAAELEVMCRQQVAQLVWNALHTPLAALGGTIGSVPAKDRLHELQFHFPEEATSARPEEGYLTGFMDLVIRRDGRFFLVDWKTNLLPSYRPDDLAQAMAASDYVRQYRLYLQALARWLGRSLGPTFDYTRDIGGVYYLFVRGLNGLDESGGVYYHRPTKDDLRQDLVLS